MDDLLLGDLQLASPPEIYRRVRRLGQQPDTSAATLAEVIGNDPGLAARLLRLANSAFFSMPQQVQDIEEAVRLVGIRELQDLVLASEVIQKFHAIPADLVDIYTFWRTSIRSAVIARSLARRSRQLARESDVLFTAALLHGVGNLVIYTRIPEFGRKALLEHRYRRWSLEQAQRAVIGFDFTEVGAALAQSWELPPLYQAVLANQLAPDPAQAYYAHTALVHLAVIVAEANSFVLQELKAVLPSQAELWRAAGLGDDMLESALEEAGSAYATALALLH